MRGFLKKRKLRKQIKETLHMARHARNMREDIADPKDMAVLASAEENVREIRRTGSEDAYQALGRLEKAANKVYPTKNNSGMRENVEVVIVALAAAMAIRAFFFQPFKIPTGSMQPTLNGILVKAQDGVTFLDYQPLKFFKWLATGASYKEFRAKVSGPIGQPRQMGDFIVMEIGGVSHKIPVYMQEALSGKIEPYYNKGQTIVSGSVIAGDHILVNKMKYNFVRPHRGDIAVFDTRNIVHPEVRPDTFYIKRMVGLPGEKIQIQKGRIVADGHIVSDPPIFEKIATDTNYVGHVPARHTSANSPRPKLLKETDAIQLADDQYLMLGDNTHNSADGRYFGAVGQDDFEGPAFFVYWPFREHWGIVR